MNEEISALYKKEGVNPAGGCLPMLIQLPFLYAFYKMLSIALDLRHAHWLWVHDLSAAESFPYVLPILMVLSSLAMYHAMRGERKPALDNLTAALRLSPKNPGLLFNAGITYQQLGDTDRALDALERSVAGGTSPATLRDTPNFDVLRVNPRYLKLVGK